MTPKNQALLQSKFFISPTPQEFRQALAQRNRRVIIKKMIDEEEAERALLSEADDYTFGDNTDREQ